MSLRDIIDQIKENPISSVVGNYLSLHKSGTNYEAVCPFHSDKNPSLKISDKLGMYNCFACGAKGDHVNFVANYKNITTIDAVKELCGLFSISTDALEQKKSDPKWEMALRVLNAATKVYRKYALENYASIYQDFLKSRGMNEETAANFDIGYAPKGNVVLKYLQSLKSNDKDFALKVAEEIGLIKQGRHGLYDAFRHRIVFPIKDQSDKVRGFSCRRVDEQDEPKYINSRESFIFNKGSILYGLNLARIPIRQKDSVLLCEGNMDVSALHQFGFNQAVASMGTAFTDSNLTRLKNMTKNFYLAMDGDDAGIKAMTKINAALMEMGIMAKFVDLSPSKDPDDYLQANGALAFQGLMDNSDTFLNYQLRKIIPSPLPDSVEERAQILIESIFPVLAPMGESIVATERAIEMARELGLETESSIIVGNYQSFLAELKSREKTPRVTEKTQPVIDIREPAKANIVTSQAIEAKSQLLSRAEKHLIKECLSCPELLTHDSLRKCLDFVQHSEVKRVVLWLKRLYLEVEDTEFLAVVGNGLNFEEMDAQIKETISASLFGGRISKVNDEALIKLAADLQQSLEIEGIKSKRVKVKEKLKLTKDKEEQNHLINEIKLLDTELSELKKNKTV